MCGSETLPGKAELTREEKDYIDNIWKKTDKKMSEVAVRSRNKLPYSAHNGVHTDKSADNVNWWTNGFWGGLMWLMYSETGNEEYRITAQNSEKLLDGAWINYDTLDHDVGFMWHITSGASYKLTGDKNSRVRNLYAASVLASRYNPDGQYIRAWNGNRAYGWTIIDCMMNIPLLYWASKEVCDERLERMAVHHADMTLRDHIRPDGSINHIVEHNPKTGEAVHVYAGQGYSETSCWTRGLSWAIYGMAISYRYTNDIKYIDAAIRCAEYFLENAQKHGYICPVDFLSPKDAKYIDSTAGVVTACGLIDIAGYIREKNALKAQKYMKAAIKLLKTTDEKFCNYNPETDCLVEMGTERYPLNKDMSGVHIPIIYGDFFFAEALTKLRGSSFCIW